MEVEPFAKSESIKDAFGIPVGSGPVEGFSCFDNLMEATTDLLKWSQIVKEVSVDDVHIL